MSLQRAISFDVSAPGKVILLGEHSVVYGKQALAASLSLQTSLHFSETTATDPDSIRVILPTININQSYDVAEINHLLLTSPPPLANGSYADYNLSTPDRINVEDFVAELRVYVAANSSVALDRGQECALIAFFLLLRGMFCCVNVSVSAFDLNVTSDLVLGAGTGSSASYGVCVAAALYQYLRRHVTRHGWISRDIARQGFNSTTITATDMSTFSSQERDLILRWAMLSDHVMHGNPSGLDATVITFGKIIKFRREQGGKPPVIEQMPLADSLKILLVNTGVSRNTKALVDGVAALRGRYPKIVDSVLVAMDQVVISATDVFNELEELKASSAQGVQVESSVGKLGELIDMNQSLLCSLRVSHPSLDEICGIARQNGLSAKLTGAGGGGYAYVLIPSSLAVSTVTALGEKLRERGYEATLAHMGGPGLVLRDDPTTSASLRDG